MIRIGCTASQPRPESGPGFDQLDAPLLVTDSRIFDYIRQEPVDILWITGGNPELGRGHRQSLSISTVVRPWRDERLALNLALRQNVSRDAVAAFPELTPLIEAAFPERITRGGDGRLSAVDARAINIARDSSAELVSGLALRLGGRRGKTPLSSAPGQWRFGFSISHRWRLHSDLLTRTGVPPIDRLRGGGESRHNVSLQATLGRSGIGGSLSGSWASSARLRGGGLGAAGLHLRPPLGIGLSAFAEPDRLFSATGKAWLLRNVKVSLDVRNLLGGYRRATLADGTVPAGYGRDEIDPLGPSIALGVRKRF